MRGSSGRRRGQQQKPAGTDSGGVVGVEWKWNWRVDRAEETEPPPRLGIREEASSEILALGFVRDDEGGRGFDLIEESSSISTLLPLYVHQYTPLAKGREEEDPGKVSFFFSPEEERTEQGPAGGQRPAEETNCAFSLSLSSTSLIHLPVGGPRPVRYLPSHCAHRIVFSRR